MAGKPVIAGTDGSPESFRAVQWAAWEAVLHSLALHIVSVPAVPPPMAPGWVTSGTLAARERQAARHMLAAAARQAAEVGPGLAVSTGMLAGDPARALAEAAHDGALRWWVPAGSRPFCSGR